MPREPESHLWTMRLLGCQSCLNTPANSCCATVSPLADSINTLMTRRTANSLITLGILAALVHVTFLFLVVPALSDRATTFYNQNRFMDGYDQLAANLVQGNGYRFYADTAKTLMREPGYPLFVAGLYLVFGSTFTSVKLANMILALATAWMMTRLSRKISTHPVMLIAPPLL